MNKKDLVYKQIVQLNYSEHNKNKVFQNKI